LSKYFKSLIWYDLRRIKSFMESYLIEKYMIFVSSFFLVFLSYLLIISQELI